MGGRITVDASGAQPTVTKRAVGASARSRLAHEAAMLELVAHPGVVRKVDYRSGDDHDELVMAFAGAATLADHRPRDLAAVAGMGAAIAGTLADLHASGLAHGAIQADHVVLGASRHPVVCSFASASQDAAAQAADTVALAGLVDELARTVEAGRGSVERRRRSLLTAATAEAAAGELSAAALAARLAAVPGAALDIGTEPGSAPDTDPDPTHHDLGTRTWRHRPAPNEQPDEADPRRTKLVLIAGVVVAVAALVALSAGRQQSVGDQRLLGVVTPTATPAAPTPTAPPVAEPQVSAPVCDSGTDIDGDGCGDDIEIVGRLIRHDQTWYAVGEPGDLVVVGHWDCAPLATPAVLRPATGEMFVFDAWPSADVVLSVTPSGSVPAGSDSLDVGEVDGCETPVAGAGA